MIPILLSIIIAATPCRSATDLSVEVLDERLAAAEAAVEAHEDDLFLWFSAVFGVHAAVMVGALTIANVSNDEGFRKEMYVAAFGSGLGIVTLLTSAPPLIGASEKVASFAGADEKRQRLALLEDILERSAKKIDFTQSWIAHASSFVYALGASLVLWLGYDRERAAITQFLGGQLIGQGRILIQPTGARDAWVDYRDRHLGGCGERAEAPPAVRVTPAGLGVLVTF